MRPLSRAPIVKHAQLRALASPARQELLDLLVRMGPCSAATLSRVVGRPADGLYYHLRTLQRVGLVREARTEDGARRRGLLYEAVHREPELRHDTAPGGNSAAVAAIVSSMLRLGTRDFRRAAATPGVRTRGPGRELWALRVTGRLSSKEVGEANRRIHALRSAVGRPGTKGKLYAVTILLVPLEHRARKKQRRRRKVPS
jgi:DNA-binding transcriptional ArsR family regulator